MTSDPELIDFATCKVMTVGVRVLFHGKVRYVCGMVWHDMVVPTSGNFLCFSTCCDVSIELEYLTLALGEACDGPMG